MAGNRSHGAPVTAITGGERTLGAAVDAFLAQPRPATTARTYTRTLEHVARRLGRDRTLADIGDEELAAAVSQLWGDRAPRTWNRHLATIRSFLSWCRRHGWPAGDLQLRADRRAVPEDDTRAIPLPELDRLWARSDIPLRERALWRLLYDSAARADEVLGLDVPDLNLANRQAKARTKGGHIRPLHFQTAAARLLAKLTAGREAGPVFLTERRTAAHRVPAAADLDPVTGRARLSYEMAEQLFKRYSGGKTLHQLRHSRLTHLGDQNVSAPLLMALSGHKRLATLQRYVKPSPAAVAALLAANDPDRRRR
jgi:site-specific recombinase XerD